MKMFSIAGVSRIRAQDPAKFRVANCSLKGRVRRLTLRGHVDIAFFELPEKMTKDQALAWFKAEKPELASQLKSKPEKAPKAPKTKAVKTAVKEVAPEVQVVDVALSPAAKLALKRVKDAARKREKRAAEKAAKAAVAA